MATRVLIAHEDSLIAASCAAILRAQSNFELDVHHELIAYRLTICCHDQDVVIASHDVARSLARKIARPERILVVVAGDFEKQLETTFSIPLGGYFVFTGGAGQFVRAVRRIARAENTLFTWAAPDFAHMRLAQKLISRSWAEAR